MAYGIIEGQNKWPFARIPYEVEEHASAVGRQGGAQEVVAAYFPAIPAGASIGAIAQLDNQVDCIYVDAAGALRVTWVVDLGAWDGPTAITPPGTATPGQALATARQTPEQIDVFFVDPNGVVNVMWVVGVGAWQGPVLV